MFQKPGKDTDLLLFLNANEQKVMYKNNDDIFLLIHAYNCHVIVL